MFRKQMDEALEQRDSLRSPPWRIYAAMCIAGLVVAGAIDYCFFVLTAKGVYSFQYMQSLLIFRFMLLGLIAIIIFRQCYNHITAYGQSFDKMNSALQNEISEHKKSKVALQESEERYRNLFENSIEGIGLSKDNKIIMANKTLIQMFGYTTFEEFAAVPLLDSVAPEYRELIKERMESRRRNKPLSQRYIYKIFKKDGEIRTFEISVSEVIVQQERYVQSTFRDITEQIRFQEQLQNTKKLETLATLAGGIAHQFNNALVGITGSIELLKMDMPIDVNGIKYICRMKTAADRMASLTNQLLAYARRGRYDPQKTSLSDFLMDALPIFESSLDPEISLDKDLSESLPFVEVDITQMQMVLSSILYNASDAVEKQGHIQISIRKEMIDTIKSTKNFMLKPGPYVCMEVKDNGKGMDKWVQDRIFEPFFSTKVQGRGLGMAAVYGIIKNHNGWISVDSEPGKGTTVRIYLPALGPVEEKTKKTPDYHGSTYPKNEPGFHEGESL